MMLAARIGVSRSEWEDMTPRELMLWSRAYGLGQARTIL